MWQGKAKVYIDGVDMTLWSDEDDGDGAQTGGQTSGANTSQHLNVSVSGASSYRSCNRRSSMDGGNILEKLKRAGFVSLALIHAWG